MNPEKTAVIMRSPTPAAGLARIVGLCVLALCGRWGPAGAQATPDRPGQLPEPDLVYSASRYAQETSEAPASVTIITAREIHQYGYRTLADILNAVRGFSTRYDFNYEYLTTRGLARQGDFNTRILVLVDGQRINAPGHDYVGIGTESLIDVDRIQQVEVIRGPGSALFGTNAFFGIVNIVTERPREGGRVDAEAGSFSTYRGSLAWGTRSELRRDVLVAASAQRRAGRDLYFPEFDDPLTNNGVAAGLDDEETYRVLAKGRWGDWALFGAYMHRRRSIPTASYGTTFDSLEQTVDWVTMGSLTYTRTFASLSRLVIAGSWLRTWYDGLYIYDSVRLSDFQEGTQWSLDAQYLRVFGPGHKATVGGEVRWVPEAEQGVSYAYPPTPPSTSFLDSRMLHAGAAFAQIEWRLSERAQLYTGLRLDHYPDIGGSTNPRLALVLRPAERTTLRVLAGTAFRAPNVYELYYQDSGVTQKAPPSLDPERVRSGELLVDQQFGGLTASVSAYVVETRKLINLVVDTTDGLLVFVNQGSPSTRGIEVELRGRAGPVTGRASYAYQEADEDGGGRPVDSPRHLARVGAALPLLGDRANLALEVRYVGERPTRTGAGAAAYTLANLTLLARPVSGRTELMVTVRDLFDTGHVDPGGEEHVQDVIRQDGRSVRVGLRFEW